MTRNRKFIVAGLALAGIGRDGNDDWRPSRDRAEHDENWQPRGRRGHQVNQRLKPLSRSWCDAQGAKTWHPQKRGLGNTETPGPTQRLITELSYRPEDSRPRLP
jgi:hypothetical protein